LPRYACIAERDGLVAPVRPPDKGLLGGMLALPNTDWRSMPWADAEAASALPGRRTPAGQIDHVFTHFALTLRVMRGQGDPPGAIWTPLAEAGDGPPSVFLKALRAGWGAEG
jgi:A/G-specific adenine glycosylase